MLSDRTEAQTDVALGDENTETPKEEPQFTPDQQAHIDKKVLDAKTAATADVGRFQAEAEKAKRDAQRSLDASTAALERTKLIRKEQDEAELKAAEGDKEQLSAVKEMQKRRMVETELDEAKLKLNQRDEELSQVKKDSEEATKTQTAQKIATRLGIDADRLIKLSKFTDGSAESMEGIAQELPKKEVRAQVVTDSGVNTGSPGSDAEFLTKFGSGDLPYTKENKERAEKLMK